MARSDNCPSDFAVVHFAVDVSTMSSLMVVVLVTWSSPSTDILNSCQVTHSCRSLATVFQTTVCNLRCVFPAITARLILDVHGRPCRLGILLQSSIVSWCDNRLTNARRETINEKTKTSRMNLTLWLVWCRRYKTEVVADESRRMRWLVCEWEIVCRVEGGDALRQTDRQTHDARLISH